jgi:hypothetical protein
MPQLFTSWLVRAPMGEQAPLHEIVAVHVTFVRLQTVRIVDVKIKGRVKFISSDPKSTPPKAHETRQVVTKPPVDPVQTLFHRCSLLTLHLSLPKYYI